jgi:hypothetical protein
MNIICKKSTSKLIKGATYEVELLYNNGTNTSWKEGRIRVKDVSGFYTVDNFTAMDGTPVQKVNLGSPVVRDIVKFEDLKVGDILVCTSDNYKTLIKNGYYKIERLDSIDKPVRYGTNTYTHKEQKFKLQGVKRTLKFNSWCFRKLSTQELRDANLNELLNNQPLKIISEPIKRKIDYLENKEVALIETLCLSILDKNRHKLSIIDWCCEKVGSKLGLNKEDFSELLEIPLKDILEYVERT